MDETTMEPTLFVHTRRPQWGLAILTEERPEKRCYLFQDGQTRVFQEDYFHMIQPADESTEHARSVSRRLQARVGVATGERSVLAKGQLEPPALDEQIAVFQALYPGGFSDPAYQAAHRGGGKRLKRHMDGAAAEAQALLGREALAALVEESRFGEIHERASTVVLGTGLCTPKLRAVVTEIPADRHADFGRALWELLHGDAPSRERFVGMVGALKANGEASWLMATLFPGLVAPHEHVVVDPHPFARNARRMEPQLVVSVTPNPIVYERLLDLSRRLEGELADHGLVARDLLDIHAFIVESTNPKNAKLLDVATKH